MFQVNIQEKSLTKLTEITFEGHSLKERYDIQEWIENNPNIVEKNLLIIGKEVVLPSNIRLDLLAIDKKSNLVIIELKRDTSGKNLDWQAIKYASYCSSFSKTDIFRQFADYLETTESEAETQIEEFIDAENFEKLNENQRIILVSKDFHSDVVSSVLWLRDYGIDISCVKLTPYLDSQGSFFINPNKIIPLPEAEDYLIKKEQKQKEVRQSKASSFSLEKGSYSHEELVKKLDSSLRRDSELTPRILEFLNIILEEKRVYKRDELKQKLYNRGIGDDIGHTGRYLSNISQFLSKKSTPHFRQIISFTGGSSGAVKDNYCVNDEYRNLLLSVISAIDSE